MINSIHVLPLSWRAQRFRQRVSENELKFEDEKLPLYTILGMKDIQIFLMRGVAKLLKARGCEEFTMKVGTILSFNFDPKTCFHCKKRRLSISRQDLQDYIQFGIKRREGLCICNTNDDSVFTDDTKGNVQDFIVIAKQPKSAKYLSLRSSIFYGGATFDILNDANLIVMRKQKHRISVSRSFTAKEFTKTFFRKHVKNLFNSSPSILNGDEQTSKTKTNSTDIVQPTTMTDSEFVDKCESEEEKLFENDPLKQYKNIQVCFDNHQTLQHIQKEERFTLIKTFMHDPRIRNKIIISDECQVHVSSEGKYGYIHPRMTQLNLTIDDSGYFKRIHIVPFEDTLPTVYNVNNVFEEYLKPYFRANPWKQYVPGGTFWYYGSQFKVLYTEDMNDDNDSKVVIQDELTPFKTPRKVGRQTLVYTHGVAIPHWIDVLPIEVVENIRRQPTRLQSLLLLQELLRMDERDLQRFITSPGQQKKEITEIDKDQLYQKYVHLMTETLYDELALANAVSEDDCKGIQCMICLECIPINDKIFIAACNHGYHPECAYHWFSHDSACPLCRSPLETVPAIDNC